MKHTLLLSAALAVMLATPAWAGNDGLKTGFYGQFNLGASFNPDSDLSLKGAPVEGTLSYDTSFALSGAAGYDFGNFRTDVEVGWTKADMNKLKISIPGIGSGSLPAQDSDITVVPFLVNGYWDIHNTSRWTPFVGAGLGFAYLSAKSPDSNLIAVDDSDMVFAVQLGGGVSYDFTDNLALVGSYRFFGTSDGSFKATEKLSGYNDSGTVKANVTSHQLRLGVRYTF